MKFKGGNKMKTLKVRILAIVTVLAFTLIPTMSVLADTTAHVDITATPSFISMTNTEGTWTLNTVSESTSYWWATGDVEPNPNTTFEAADMKSEIENTGTVAVDIGIVADNFTGGVGWALVTGAAGANTVHLQAGTTGCASIAAMLDLEDGASQELVDNLTATSTIKWCMLLQTGTFTDGVEKVGLVTLTATLHT
jgi:hypothetical protein